MNLLFPDEFFILLQLIVKDEDTGLDKSALAHFKYKALAYKFPCFAHIVEDAKKLIDIIVWENTWIRFTSRNEKWQARQGENPYTSWDTATL